MVHFLVRFACVAEQKLAGIKEGNFGESESGNSVSKNANLNFEDTSDDETRSKRST